MFVWNKFIGETKDDTYTERLIPKGQRFSIISMFSKYQHGIKFFSHIPHKTLVGGKQTLKIIA